MTTNLFSSLSLNRGPAMENRFMLAPLTNQQSNPDGTPSEDDHRFLSMRAKGGFGATMTCGAHVQASGQGFERQLAIFDDEQIPGLRKLARAIKEEGSVAIVQLYHGGMRSLAGPEDQQPVCPSDNEEFDARALTVEEVGQLRDDFISAAVRAETAGFDGVELHGAHGYIICQFLSEEINKRTDQYGGSYENRVRLLNEIIDGVRAACGDDFILGLRLSAERFGTNLLEMKRLASECMVSGRIDFLDMSLWNAFGKPIDPDLQSKTLIEHFTEVERGDVPLGISGTLRSGADCQNAISAGADFVLVGRAAIAHHDFPTKVKEDPNFAEDALPVSTSHLANEGVGEAFIEYLRTFNGIVAD
ncbi:MAG: NADH:flavin oxidoreductase [Pseudomonadota bacterium]